MMLPQDILFHQDGPAFRITLNRPDSGNRITMEMISALAQALERLAPETKLVVLCANGPDFCQGRDYQAAPESAHGGRAPNALQVRSRMTAPIVALYSTIRGLPVPTLAAVRGAASGFGTALAGACDILVASSSARFSLPEMKRALPPTLAMTALHERIGPRALAYLALSTAEVDARCAMAMGLASVVCEEAEFERELGALVQTICSHPLDAIHAVVQLLRMAPQMGPAARADFAAGLFAGVMSSR